MLYEQYANKIKRYARIRDNVLRFKIPIICVISAALLAWAGFLITKGMITEQVSGDSEYVYGEGISFKAKALFSDVTFEYSNGGEWSEEKPIMPGQYQVRAVSDQSFGRRNHSDPFSFVITQKPLTLSITDKTVQWRDVPRVAADGLVRGDSFESAAVALSNQGLGQSDANIDPSSAVILNANGDNVSAAYLITAQTGVVEVTPRTVTLSADNVSKVYDGSALTVGGYQLSAGRVVEGQSLSVDLSVPEFSGVGSEKISVNSAKVIENGVDVTEFYRFTFVAGNATITKRDVAVVSEGAAKVYDGTKLDIPKVNIPEVAPTDEIVISANTPEIIVPNGDGVEHITGYTIKNKLTGEDVSANYNVTERFGLLKVSKRDITIVTSSMTKEYDGTELTTNNEYEIVGGLGQGDTSEAVSPAVSITDAVETENSITVEIECQHGVENCYNIGYNFGTLEITPKKITISSQIAQKPYDGTALEIPVPVIDYDKIAEKDTLTVKLYQDKIIKPNGNGVPHIIGYTISDADGDASGNYEIDYNQGLLLVTKRQITIITESKTWEYDGEVHSTEGKYSIGGDGIAPKDNFRVEVYIEIDEVGQSGAENKLYYSISCVNDYDYWECYEVTEQFGTLTVTPRRITVTSASASKTYDGTPLTVGSATATREADSGVELVTGHYIDVIWSDSITDVVRDYSGNVISVENIIEFVIRDANYNDVTANYDFGDKGSREGRLVFGTLTINPVKLTVTVKDIEKTYDGIEIYSLTVNENYTVTEIEGHILSGHSLNVYLTAPVIDVTNGQQEFTARYTISMSNNYDVTVCYAEGRSYGYINIKPYEVNISINNIDKIYDAQAVFASNNVNYFIENFEEFDSFMMRRRHTYVISINNTFVNAGEYQWTVVFYADRGGIDATKNFKVTVTGTEGNNNGYAKLTINKRVLNYYCGGNTWEYDGEVHEERYNILQDIENENQGLLNEFHYFVPTGWTTITDVGEDLNVIAFLIYDEDVDVTGNYDINLIREKCEKLIVTPRRIDVKSDDATKTYDGTPLVANSATVTRSVDDGFALVAGHTIKITDWKKDYINVIRKPLTGEVESLENLIKFVILDADGKDVTGNYEISYTSGKLTINPRKLTITSGSGSWIYDRSEHSNRTYTLGGEGLVNGHTLLESAFSIIGKRTLVGTAKNIICSEVTNIHYTDTEKYLEGYIWADEKDLTSNYDIAFSEGTLEVLPIVLTVTPNYVGGEYNGQEYQSTEGRQTAGTLLDGDEGILFILTQGTRTDAGQGVSTVRIVVIRDKFGIGVWANGENTYYDFYDKSKAMYVEADGLILEITYDGVVRKVDSIPNDGNNQKLVELNGEIATEGCYTVNAVEGEINVRARKITVTCESATEKYSKDKSLTAGARISKGSIVDGQTEKIITVGKATEKGVAVENALELIKITDNEGNDVTHNYDITVIKGTLLLE